MNASLPDVPEVRVVGLPLLTSGFDLVERLDLAMHLKVHGPLEPIAGEQLATLAEQISLRGRGGAGFPFAKKLRAVAEAAIRRGVRPVVVINGSEDEPACRKDTVLINRAPHLILDGALLAAEALGARTLVVGVTRDSTEASMQSALAERGLSNRRGSILRARVQRNPVRMVTGESSALVRSADGGPPLPPGRKVRTSDSGVGGALDDGLLELFGGLPPVGFVLVEPAGGGSTATVGRQCQCLTRRPKKSWRTCRAAPRSSC